MATCTEATLQGSEIIKKPQKKYYRQRAHTNPLADHSFDYPVKPSAWTSTFGNLFDNVPQSCVKQDGNPNVTFADVGCGYGGLLLKLSTMFPQNLALGMEIRVKVSDYVIDVSS